jgi:hypothetical protein
MRRIWISATLICAFAITPAHPQTTSVTFPEVNGLIEFMLPSANIACVYIARSTATYMPRGGGPELSCDRREPTYVNVDLGPTGAAQRTDNPGEQSCCGGPNTLQYGQTWAAGPFNCQSSEADLVCAHRNGHGFTMSRTKIEVR